MRPQALFAIAVMAAAATLPAAPASAQTCPTGPNLHEGKVRFFNDLKGYGYIVPASGGPEVFVHHAALGALKIKENDRVVFEVEDRGKGPVAVNVRLCS